MGWNTRTNTGEQGACCSLQWAWLFFFPPHFPVPSLPSHLLFPSLSSFPGLLNTVITVCGCFLAIETGWLAQRLTVSSSVLLYMLDTCNNNKTHYVRVVVYGSDPHSLRKIAQACIRYGDKNKLLSFLEVKAVLELWNPPQLYRLICCEGPLPN